MADNNLPVPNTAPNGDAPQPTPNPQTPPNANTPPSEPVSKPADAPAGNPATLTLEAFSEDEQKYLKSQGVTDFTSPEAIKKIINHAQSSQKTAADIKNQLDKVQSAFNPHAVATNPLVNPAPSSQPQTDGNPVTPPAGNAGGLDPVMAFTLTSQLAQSYPHITEDLTNGKFYQDMQTMGIQLKGADGQVNIDGIINYAKMVNGQRELEAKLEQASKPGENAIPDANPTTPAQPADDAPMTRQLATAIAYHASRGVVHPRAEEAKQFLQKNIGTK